MKRHAGLAISAAICLLLSAVACGSKQDADSDTTAASSVSATEESSETAAATQTPSKKLTAAGTGKPVRTVPAEKVKTYTHSNKVFLLNGYSASLKMENGWEIRSGGTATDQQSDSITSYPAVVQYLDSKDVVTITVLDEVEDKDSLLEQRIPILLRMAVHLTAFPLLRFSSVPLVRMTPLKCMRMW